MSSNRCCTLVSVILILSLEQSALADPVALIRSFNPNGTDRVSFEGVVNAGSQLYGYNGVTLYAVGIDGTNRHTIHIFGGQTVSGSLASDGTSIYGTTFNGGANVAGSVWAIDANGSNFRTVASMNTTGPYHPQGGVTLLGSTLYGTTLDGGLGFNAGNGTVFSVSTGGGPINTIHEFTDEEGGNSASALLSNGTALFGISPPAGSGANKGMLFSVGGPTFAVHTFSGGVDGTVTALFGATSSGALGGSTSETFAVRPDGSDFHKISNLGTSELTRANDLLYGTTAGGGTYGRGTVFSIHGDGTGFQVLHSFSGGPFDGDGPLPGLLLVGNNLLGSTSFGGVNNTGVVFSIAVPEPSSIVLGASSLLTLLVAAGRKSADRARRS